MTTTSCHSQGISMEINSPCPLLSHYASPLYQTIWITRMNYKHLCLMNEFGAECFELYLQDQIFALTGCLDSNL